MKRLAIASFLLVAATKATAADPPGALRIGTYGTCGCSADGPLGSGMTLTLAPDGLFRWSDRTGTGDREDQSGTWRVEGRKLVLTTDGAERTWTLDKDTPCLRTREGLTFTRLCLLEACH